MVKVLINSQGKVYTSSGKAIISTKNITSLSVTPTTSSQTITAPSGTDGYNPISVAAVTSSIDANITAGNIKKDVTILDVTGTYEGGGGAYQLHRIRDDNNNEIGTAFMEFEDANGNKFDVVCLDAQYRSTGEVWCSYTSNVTNMPLYNSNLNAWWYDNARETATQNTQLILDYCSSNGYTSGACTYCRSKSFIIDNTVYYGQLPNMKELFEMLTNRVQIEQMDISASNYSKKNFSSKRSIWSSSQCSSSNSWGFYNSGSVSDLNKTYSIFVAPVLELPK